MLLLAKILIPQDTICMTGSNRYEHTLEQLKFEALALHDVIAITTGKGEAAWEFYFVVNSVGSRIKGLFSARDPFGDEIEEFSFELLGCGRWTSQDENPMQRPLTDAFTPFYDELDVGSYIFGRFEGTQDLICFDNPGQEITDLTHLKASP